MKKDTRLVVPLKIGIKQCQFSLQNSMQHNDKITMSLSSSKRLLEKKSPKLLPKLYNKDIKECIVVQFSSSART